MRQRKRKRAPSAAEIEKAASLSGPEADVEAALSIHYDVRLLYRRAKAVTEEEGETILHWRNAAVDKRMDAQAVAARWMQRATPMLTTGAPTQCLVRHLSKGKAATLVPPGTRNTEPASHLLLQHGGCIYLRRLLSSPMLAEDQDMKILKMGLIGSQIRQEAFKELMWRNVLETRPPKEADAGGDPPEGIGRGSRGGGLQLVDLCPAEGSRYTTTVGLSSATRHMPLHDASTVLWDNSYREDCWQAGKDLLEVIALENPSVGDAARAAELLFRLHAQGTSNEWGGTRSSGSSKVEAFKHFSTLWKEVSWALHNAAEASPIMGPVAAAAVELTAPNTKGPRVYDKKDKPAYDRPKFKQTDANVSTQQWAAPTGIQGSLFDQYWTSHQKKRAKTAALPFEGRGNGADELYGGEFVGKKGHRQ